MAQLALGLQTLLYGFVHWFLEENKRPESDYGSGEDTKRSLARLGWIDRQVVNGRAMTDEEADRAYKYRQAVITSLQENALKNDEAAKKLAVLTGPGGLWVDENGHLIRPSFAANMAFRRGTFYPDAMVMRTRELKPEDRAAHNRHVDIPKEIPVNVKVYKSELERVIDQMMENEKMTEGALPLSYIARVDIAKLFWDAGYRESQFRAHFKDGVGQKLFSTYKVDNMCPEAKLLERGHLAKDDAMFVNLQSLNAGELRKLYTDKPAGYKIPVEQVEKLISDIGGTTIRPISRPQMLEISERRSCTYHKELLNAVADGKPELLVGYMTIMEPLINEGVRLRNAGLLEKGVEALKSIVVEVAEAAPVVSEPGLAQAEAAPPVQADEGNGSKKKAKK